MAKNRTRYFKIQWLVPFLAPFILGPLIAPFVFNLLVRLGREHAALENLRHIEFESILGRCILLVALTAIWPALALARKVGWGPHKMFGDVKIRSLVQGLLLGIGSMLLLPLAGLLLGAYEAAEGLGAADLLGAAIGFLAVGIIVGLIEEFIFRGMIFGLIDRSTGIWPAALISSGLYSLVHFIDPVLPAGVVHGHWYSGFHTLGVAAKSFASFNSHIFPYCLTLFLIGMSLCLLYSRKGRLFLAIGVHAGWILVLKLAKKVLERTDRYEWIFGQDMVMSKTYAVAIIAAIFLLAVLLAKKNADNPSRSRFHISVIGD